MNLYGVEMNVAEGKMPGFFAQTVKEIASSVNVIDRDRFLYIVNTEEDKIKLENIFKKRDLYEETYCLYPLHHPQLTLKFSDYGFTTATNKHYLYTEMTEPFHILSGETEQIEMALLQMEEHLITVDNDNYKPTYYVDHHEVELIIRIAKAYEVQVSFLDLDKST